MREMFVLTASVTVSCDGTGAMVLLVVVGSVGSVAVSSAVWQARVPSLYTPGGSEWR